MIRGFVGYYKKNGELTDKQRAIVEQNWVGSTDKFTADVLYNEELFLKTFKDFSRRSVAFLDLNSKT